MPRAQRLSASQTWSPMGGAYIRTNDGGVLNASRRHRLGHLETGGENQAATECSTPLGVTDLVTRGHGPDQLSEGGCVLNASRRHRLGHATGRGNAGKPEVCSTPLGVTDLVTRPAENCSDWFRSAQRLSASQTWSLRLQRRCRLLSRVLNASRRHRLGHHSAATCCACLACAQRLSASQTWSLPGRADSRSAASCAQRLSASQTWSRDRAGQRR